MIGPETLVAPTQAPTEPSYPTNVVAGDCEYGRLHRGHHLDEVLLRIDLLENGRDGDLSAAGYTIVIEETYLTWRWVKQCTQGLEWPCALDGKGWHGHWDSAAAHPSRAFTKAYWVLGAGR